MLVLKNPPAIAGDVRDVGLIPRSIRSHGGGHDNPLQYSCLENPVHRGAWQATVHGVAQSQTRLERLSREQGLIISDTPQELLSHGGKWGSRGSVNLSAQDPGPIPSSYSCVHPLKSVRRKESSICQSQHSWNLAKTSWDIYSLTLFSQGGMYGQSPIQGTSVLSGQVTQGEHRAS